MTGLLLFDEQLVSLVVISGNQAFIHLLYFFTEGLELSPFTKMTPGSDQPSAFSLSGRRFD